MTAPPSPPWTTQAALALQLGDAAELVDISIQGQLVRKRKLSKSLIFGDVELADNGSLQVMFRAGEHSWTKESVVQLNWDIHIGDVITATGTLKREDDGRFLLNAAVCVVTDSWKVSHPGVPFDQALPEAAPQVLARKQEYTHMIQLRGQNACKYHFSNASCTRGETCHFWHGAPDEYKSLQQEWLAKRAEQKRELTLLEDDPHDPHEKELKTHRARIFAEWLVELYGHERLRRGTGVIDVAGGKGDIDFELAMLRAIPSTLIDPRVVKTRKTHLKYMAQHGKPKWRHLLAELNDDLIAAQEDLFRDCSLVVGMHPDEATEAIVDAALAVAKPFAIVPCCVMSRLFPDRIVDGEKVATYDAFVKYLKAKHPEIQSAFLPFAGRNQVLYML
ncbi:Aste57867_21459 [Aphanomyces stellatus]|uniref:Aste57867_21459 protein n=1 Tax=Aphanomyces stellatus TaxID=120398 RepID=A0A485LIV1_9STRA|nr:hypothetical protein As57867_021390 [Aphanomyces stellatus]VFT98130.1 Aste57867_21459 [Aphanomyces stellatus]